MENKYAFKNKEELAILTKKVCPVHETDSLWDKSTQLCIFIFGTAELKVHPGEGCTLNHLLKIMMAAYQNDPHNYLAGLYSDYHLAKDEKDAYKQFIKLCGDFLKGLTLSGAAEIRNYLKKG